MIARTDTLKAFRITTLVGAITISGVQVVLSTPMWCSPPVAKAEPRPAEAIPQEKAEPKSAEAVPRESYRTWSLFLVCNPEWLLPASNERLRDLYDQFQAFGTAIGPDNLAVWFWRGKPNRSSPRLASNLDVERSIRFCRAFNLLPSQGPHVLVTSEYPDEKNPHIHIPPSYSVIELAGRNPEQISKYLANLTDKLVLQGLNTKTPDSKEYWATWYEAVRASLKGVSDRVKVTVNTSFLKVEVSGDMHQN